jgi:hypothetical protein
MDDEVSRMPLWKVRKYLEAFLERGDAGVQPQFAAATGSAERVQAPLEALAAMGFNAQRIETPN